MYVTGIVKPRCLLWWRGFELKKIEKGNKALGDLKSGYK